MGPFAPVLTRWLVAAGLLFVLTDSMHASSTSPADSLMPDPAKVEIEGPPAEASVGGKYRTLLRRLTIPEDAQTYARFHDFGFWAGTEWRNHKNLPSGHWVYVYPHWYIWQDCVQGR